MFFFSQTGNLACEPMQSLDALCCNIPPKIISLLWHDGENHFIETKFCGLFDLVVVTPAWFLSVHLNRALKYRLNIVPVIIRVKPRAELERKSIDQQQVSPSITIRLSGCLCGTRAFDAVQGLGLRTVMCSVYNVYMTVLHSVKGGLDLRGACIFLKRFKVCGMFRCLCRLHFLDLVIKCGASTEASLIMMPCCYFYARDWH